MLRRHIAVSYRSRFAIRRELNEMTAAKSLAEYPKQSKPLVQ